MIYTRKITPEFGCYYKASKRGYWDACGFLSMSKANKQKTMTMTPYAGITPEINNGVVTFSEALLPDYTLLPAQTALLAKAGLNYLYADGLGNISVRDDGLLDNCFDSAQATTYNLFVKNHKPILSLAENISDGLFCNQYTVAAHTPTAMYCAHFSLSSGTSLSGNSLSEVTLSQGGYLTCDYHFAEQTMSRFNIDVIMHVKTGSSVSGRQVLFNLGDFWFGINNGTFALSDGLTIVNGRNASANKTYWVRLRTSGSPTQTFMILYLEDNGSYTLNTLPSYVLWNVGASSQFGTTAADDNYLILSDETYSWLGKIDLLNSKMQVQNYGQSWQEVWRLVETVA